MNRKLLATFAFAAAIAIKLPYEAGQSFVVVQGYDSPPTHINKDLYAIDFSQDRCDAYGKLAVAANDGQVMLAQESGYNGGYGTQVLVVNDNRIVARYAHMIPGTIPATVAIGDAVVQGEPLGEIGNTGLVAGAACPTHPGTHIHFAMYGENTDGSFSPFLPEPISNYVGITAGRWYLSDNALAVATVSGATAVISRAAQAVFGTAGAGSVSSSPSPVIAVTSTNTPTGGVSFSLAPPEPSAPTPSQSTTPSLASSSVENGSSSVAAVAATATISFDSSTLAVDISWPANALASSTATNTVYQIFSSAAATSTLIATTTATNFSYPLAASDFGASPQFAITAVSSDSSTIFSTIETVPISIPNWWTEIQPVDDTNSNGSWYDDNWYDLGTGFYGDIRSLTLEGFIDSSDYFASHLYLDEYLDADYTELNQTYTISDHAPFTDGLQKVTIGGLDIPLQPNKYYRLRTYQDYQNRSIILAGTPATGTAMWDGYIYDVGIVRYEYPFYPYLAAVMIPDYPPLMPPNQVPSLSISFDSLNSLINFSWPAATDPDTTSSLLTYQINVATSATSGSSPALDATQWQSVGKNLATSTPVVFGNSYSIGVRAVDDLGNIGTPLVESWNFPASYAPVPSQLDHSVVLPGGDGSAQEITLVATTTIGGVALWTDGEFGAWCCSDSAVSIHPDVSGTPGATLAESDTIRVGPYTGEGERVYPFADPPTLSPGAYWFSVDDPTNLNDIQIFGSPGDSYAGGEWSTAPGQDAYFRIEQSDGP